MPVGTPGYWNTSRRTIQCVTCFQNHALQPSEDPTSQAGAGSEIRKPRVDARPDIPGRSAQREFERRAERELSKQREAMAKDAAWRSEIKQTRRFLGPLIAAMTPKPQVGHLQQSTTAWGKGAHGERQVAEILLGIPGIEVLHDRLIPGRGPANIDHIIVCPVGVLVVDAKKHEGTLEIQNRGSRLNPDLRLLVAKRDRTNLTNGVHSQVKAVRSVLGDEWCEVGLYGMLCFIDGRWITERPISLNEVKFVGLESLRE
jgi:hypothetical protein